MESEGVSLPLIHEHSMVPWNHLGKGSCCGGFEAITDGFYCEGCKFFVHKKCSESSKFIQHPSHSGHTLQLQRILRQHNCNLCGRIIKKLLYRCEICDFNIDLYCLKYPPPEVIDSSETHQHKLTLLKERISFDCSAKQCYKTGRKEFAYKCHECDLTFHVDCVWHPLSHPLEYTTIDAGERVSLPWFHEHFMLPWNDVRKGRCCGRFESITDGYYCKRCDFFVHKKCSNETSQSIQHPSHSRHPLWLRSAPRNNTCNICGKRIVDLFYRCVICSVDADLHCASYPPPAVIDISKAHHHKLILLKKRIKFKCDAKCGKTGEYEFAYKCHECDLTFHMDCVWHPSEAKHTLEVNHSYHPLHPLKLYMGQLPDYSDGKCRLCGSQIDRRLFYHCSTCNFTLDMRCVLKPPPRCMLHLKAHEHQLTLLPRLDSFTCNACGLKGDRSPYACFDLQCGFMIHQSCLDLPRVININRHDHRITRTPLLGVVDSICGVCHTKVDWTYGGYSCLSCPGYIVHSKCATIKGVWNGKELEGVPEEIEDIEPYVVIDDNTINHFSHKEHNLRHHVKDVLFEESKRCKACSHPVGFHSFYGCLDCDFILHQNCAELPKKRWHALHNDRLTLVTSEVDIFRCAVCERYSNGFFYQHLGMKIDVRCISISEALVHPSHPDHPLYYMYKDEGQICEGCRKMVFRTQTCIEDDCEFALCFKCVTLPKVVKHRVDDQPLSLCYGGEKASGKCWCDICEKETRPEKWFYTCKDHRASLHTECVLGKYAGLMPRSTIKTWGAVEVVINNSVTRPICGKCESRCMYPIIFKLLGSSDTYLCSLECQRRIK